MVTERVLEGTCDPSWAHQNTFRECSWNRWRRAALLWALGIRQAWRWEALCDVNEPLPKTVANTEKHTNESQEKEIEFRHCLNSQICSQNALVKRTNDSHFV